MAIKSYIKRTLKSLNNQKLKGKTISRNYRLDSERVPKSSEQMAAQLSKQLTYLEMRCASFIATTAHLKHWLSLFLTFTTTIFALIRFGVGIQLRPCMDSYFAALRWRFSTLFTANCHFVRPSVRPLCIFFSNFQTLFAWHFMIWLFFPF